MSLFKKVAVCTDLHFGPTSNNQQHNQDCSDFIDWFIETAKANGCEFYDPKLLLKIYQNL